MIGTAETENEGWTFNGFRTTTGSEVETFFNAYIAENRQYDGYDTSLASAYNFSFPFTKPDLVETYPYQNGMLINYWDSSEADNNVGDHPGSGLVLPVDANPRVQPLAGQHPDASADPVLRLDVLARADRRDHAEA